MCPVDIPDCIAISPHFADQGHRGSHLKEFGPVVVAAEVHKKGIGVHRRKTGWIENHGHSY